MVEAREVYGITDFSGGINTRQAPTLLAENESEDLKNFHIGRQRLEKRKGYNFTGVFPNSVAAFTQSDDFNRSNSTNIAPIERWLESKGDWSIESNRLHYDSIDNAGVTQGRVIVYGAQQFLNGYAECRCHFFATSIGGPTVRWQAHEDSGYAVDFLETAAGVYTIRLWRYDFGRGELLDSLASQTMTLTDAGVMVRLNADGTTISVDIDTVEKISVTDDAYDRGYVGVRVSAQAPTADEAFDDFTSDDMGTPSTDHIEGSVVNGLYAGKNDQSTMILCLSGGAMAGRVLAQTPEPASQAVPYDFSGLVGQPGGVWTTEPEARAVIVNFKENFIVADGHTPPMRVYIEQTNLLLAAAPLDRNIRNGGGSPTGTLINSVQALAVHNNSLVIGNFVLENEDGTHTKAFNGLHATDAGTLDTFTQADTTRIDVDDGDGDRIQGIHSVLGYLVVLKRDSLYRIENYGEATQFVRKIANVGTAGPLTSTVHGTQVWFLDSIGQLWVYDARGETEDDVVNVSDTKLGAPTLDTFEQDKLPMASIIFVEERNEIRYSVPVNSAVSPNEVWVYSLASGGFSIFDYLNDMAIIAAGEDDTLDQIVLGAQRISDIKVAQLDAGLVDANTTNFVGTAKTRHISAGRPDVIKGWRKALVHSELDTAQTLTFDVFLDFATGIPPGDRYSMALPDNLGVTEQVLIGRSRWLQLTLTTASVAKDLSIDAVILYTVSGEQ